MIEAVFMPSKKSTVAIKMLLTATRDQLSFILTQTQNCLNIWDHHSYVLRSMVNGFFSPLLHDMRSSKSSPRCLLLCLWTTFTSHTPFSTVFHSWISNHYLHGT